MREVKIAIFLGLAIFLAVWTGWILWDVFKEYRK